MQDQAGPAELARLWIESWNRGTPETIPLAESFVHTSPLGRIEGRERFIETIKPLSAKNVASLSIRKIVAQDGTAVVMYEVKTPEGASRLACDWLTVEGDEIAAVDAFYDASGTEKP